jgi:hypothetical protein
MQSEHTDSKTNPLDVQQLLRDSQCTPDDGHSSVVGARTDVFGVRRDVWCVRPKALRAEGGKRMPLRVRFYGQHAAVTEILAREDTNQGKVCTQHDTAVGCVAAVAFKEVWHCTSCNLN